MEEGSFHIVDVTQYHELNLETEEQWVFIERNGVLVDGDYDLIPEIVEELLKR